MTAPKQTGLLLSPDLAQKAHTGEKTVTRRPLKWPKGFPEWSGPDAPELTFEPLKGFPAMFTVWETEYPEEGSLNITCPYGGPGDLLYVRETWGVAFAFPDEADVRPDPRYHRIIYRGAAVPESPVAVMTKWKPSTHMPKWASRTWGRIIKRTAERVQDIAKDPREFVREGYSVPFEGTISWALVAQQWFIDRIEAAYPGQWDRNDFCWRIEWESCEAPR